MIDYNKVWEELNNDGEGFTVGNIDEDINNIEELRGYELIKGAETNNDVAVYTNNVQTIIVGLSNGPWAVFDFNFKTRTVTCTCACCGIEVIGKDAVWFNGEPFCKACMKAGI